MQRIILFGRKDETTNAVYHALAKHFDVPAAVLEEKVSGSVVFRRRARRLGVVSAVGQALFVTLVVPILNTLARRRKHQIIEEKKLNIAPIPNAHVVEIQSINDPSVSALVLKERPDAVVVYGTRLISSKLLEAISAPVINIHLGWNPTYRGGNGAYWALRGNDSEHCGVTVHMIDAGVDTGKVLQRAKIKPTNKDSFVTYPLLQLSAGITALIAVLQRDSQKVVSTEGEQSGLWYHPTAWGYLWYRLTRGVK